MGLLLVMPDLVENQLRVLVEGHRQQAADALRRGIADERGRVFAGRRKKQPSTVTGDQITDSFAPIRGQLQRVRIEQDDRVVGEQLLGLIRQVIDNHVAVAHRVDIRRLQPATELKRAVALQQPGQVTVFPTGRARDDQDPQGVFDDVDGDLLAVVVGHRFVGVHRDADRVAEAAHRRLAMVETDRRHAVIRAEGDLAGSDDPFDPVTVSRPLGEFDGDCFPGEALSGDLADDGEGIVGEYVVGGDDFRDAQITRFGGIADSNHVQGNPPIAGVSPDARQIVALIDPAVGEQHHPGDRRPPQRFDRAANRAAQVGGRPH
jgi:hypothetical protein